MSDGRNALAIAVILNGAGYSVNSGIPTIATRTEGGNTRRLAASKHSTTTKRPAAGGGSDKPYLTTRVTLWPDPSIRG